MDNSNFFKILNFLEQNAGDGKFYDIDVFLESLGIIDSTAKLNVLRDLKDEDFISFEGGMKGGGGIYFGNFSYTQGRWYEPYKAKIRPKGSAFIKQNNPIMKNYTVSVGNNSTTNIVIESQNVQINNLEQFKEIIKTINEKITLDNQAGEEAKTKAYALLKEALEEAEKGKIQKSTMNNILDLADKFSSIGSFIATIVQPLIGIQ